MTTVLLVALLISAGLWIWALTLVDIVKYRRRQRSQNRPAVQALTWPDGCRLPIGAELARVEWGSDRQWLHDQLGACGCNPRHSDAHPSTCGCAVCCTRWVDVVIKPSSPSVPVQLRKIDVTRHE